MAKSSFTKMKFSGLSVTAPDYIRSIDDDLALFDNNPVKLARAKKLIGFGTRYRAPEGCTPTDLCRAAVRRLIDDMAIDVNSVDALILVTQKPDYSQPGSSYIIHRDFNFPKSCAAFDINHGCPGFIYGLWVAGSLLESGACRKIMLVAGDYYGSYNELRNQMLFGDAGSAALLEYDPQAGPSHFNIQADGHGFEAIINPAGGARLPIRADVLDLEVIDKHGEALRLVDGYIDGLEVFNFSVREVPPNIAELLEFAGAKLDEIDFVAFHQTSKQIVDRVAAKTGLRPEQYSTSTFSVYGNQSVASVPGVIAHMLKDKVARGRQKVILSGYGIGAAWGSCLLDLDHIYCSGLVLEKFDRQPSREEVIAYWIKKLGT
ncbi:MAG: hypothetical protein LBS31_09910 [Candidatus Adiutrix sp.]|jgi:3-oxoacyl-[acyl-carrier-protein] synthase-3|nr:hypothetical protein [Candidatus Adiutrix sp.]